MQVLKSGSNAIPLPFRSGHSKEIVLAKQNDWEGGHFAVCLENS